MIATLPTLEYLKKLGEFLSEENAERFDMSVFKRPAYNTTYGYSGDAIGHIAAIAPHIDEKIEWTFGKHGQPRICNKHGDVIRDEMVATILFDIAEYVAYALFDERAYVDDSQKAVGKRILKYCKLVGRDWSVEKLSHIKSLPYALSDNYGRILAFYPTAASAIEDSHEWFKSGRIVVRQEPCYN